MPQMNQLEIDRIVAAVLAKLSREEPASAAEDIETVVQRAKIAQQKYQALGLDARKRAIEAIRKVSLENAAMLGQLAVEETGLGKMPDKSEKIILAATKTPGTEDLITRAFTGDHGLTIEEPAPYGVVLSITPCTNPAETLINNAISNLAAGNAIIFQPHPSAKRVCTKMAEIMRNAISSVGVPADVIASIKEPTMETAEALLKHTEIDLVVVTGGMGVVKAAMNCGKKAICAGPGNPPVIVDETADIEKAVRDIVAGASFDNGILCTAEKETIVVNQIADEFLQKISMAGAYRLSPSEAERITSLVVEKDEKGKGERHPTVKKEFVGKNASVIASAAGIAVDEKTPLLFFETVWDHPLVMAEQLMPVMPVVRVANVDEAMRLAVLVEHGFRHTFIMHSKNIERLSKMAKLCNGNIFVKNAPSYAGLGYKGEGYTSLTIAGTTGEGMTSAKSFARPRRCVVAEYFRII